METVVTTGSIRMETDPKKLAADRRYEDTRSRPCIKKPMSRELNVSRRRLRGRSRKKLERNETKLLDSRCHLRAQRRETVRVDGSGHRGGMEQSVSGGREAMTGHATFANDHEIYAQLLPTLGVEICTTTRPTRSSTP
jgi:hypothetical protein